MQYLTDAAGRVMTTIDGLGNRTYQSWDPLNRLLQITDALGGQTRFTYDEDGHLKTQTDANGNTTIFAFNAIGEVQSRQDPLGRLETMLYEPGGKLSQRTDRKGQVSGVTYDNLGRPATIGFGATAANPTAYTSTATLTWDAGNRLTNIVDVQNGVTTTIKRGYDDLDRMTSEQTEQGEVDYTYYPNGQRQTMTVKNGPPNARTTAQSVSYAYDGADRPSAITQAPGPLNNNTAQTVHFTFDDAGELKQESFTGGQSINYLYTDAGEVQSITYLKPDGTTLATGSYTYDNAGHRTSVSGDLATFVQAGGADVTDAAYNANDELTTWLGKSYTYDANGNLTSDGTNTYAWDERNQLKSITGAVSAIFAYDAQGRRLSKTISGALTGYQYDGDNFVQELSALGGSGSPTANLLTGDIDQLFMRSTPGATATLHWVLPEANNSTVITTDSSGTTQHSYAYDPYGNVSQSGTAETNTQQYTGRENDGTGLYYYRNRYYAPGCVRFISEDPIGWASGQTNNYAYVGGNPIQFTDPSGKFVPFITGVIGAIAGGGGYLIGRWARGCSIDGWDFAGAIGVGAVAGALAPFGGSLITAAGIGGVANITQDLISNLVHGRATNLEDEEQSFLFGAAAGAFAGPYVKTGRYGYSATAASRDMVDASNAAREIRSNVGLGSAVRNMTGGAGSTAAAGCD